MNDLAFGFEINIDRIKPFLLDREGQFYTFLIKRSFIPLIFLPDEGNFWDDCFSIDEMKHEEYGRIFESKVSECIENVMEEL